MSGDRGIYNTDGYGKHKWPDGWGSLCPEPDELPETPQDLLATGVQVGGAVFNVSGRYALRAFEHASGRWHGHPIPWSRLPVEAKGALVARHRLTEARWRTALREGWGLEFDR